MQTINNLKCVKFQSQCTLDFFFQIGIAKDSDNDWWLSITTHNLQTGFNNKEVKYETSIWNMKQLNIRYTHIKENKPIQHGMMNERSMGYIAHEHENNMHDE